MGKYVLKRIGYIGVVLIIISLLLYCLFSLIPSDPALLEVEPFRDTVSPEVFEQMYQVARNRLGLDDPLLVRYLRWLGAWEDADGTYNGILQGNLGYSIFFKTEVRQAINGPITNTLFLNLLSTFMALAITIPLGIATGIRKNTKFDQTVQVVTIVGYSIPVYIIGLVFIYFFAVQLRWFPVGGMKSATANYTGARDLLDRLYHFGLPLLVMTFANLGSMTRYVRAAMIDVMSMDYIRTARAKGLKEKMVIYSHAWRNALLPVVTVIITWFLKLFSGSVVIEHTFSLNGMGALYINALNNLDYELVMAIQLFFTIVSLIGLLLCDLIYGLVDPRVRVNK